MVPLMASFFQRSLSHLKLQPSRKVGSSETQYVTRFCNDISFSDIIFDRITTIALVFCNNFKAFSINRERAQDIHGDKPLSSHICM